jgi:hypothetical protein
MRRRAEPAFPTIDPSSPHLAAHSSKGSAAIMGIPNIERRDDIKIHLAAEIGPTAHRVRISAH